MLRLSPTVATSLPLDPVAQENRHISAWETPGSIQSDRLFANLMTLADLKLHLSFIIWYNVCIYIIYIYIIEYYIILYYNVIITCVFFVLSHQVCWDLGSLIALQLVSPSRHGEALRRQSGRWDCAMKNDHHQVQWGYFTIKIGTYSQPAVSHITWYTVEPWISGLGSGWIMTTSLPHCDVIGTDGYLGLR